MLTWVLDEYGWPRWTVTALLSHSCLNADITASIPLIASILFLYPWRMFWKPWTLRASFKSRNNSGRKEEVFFCVTEISLLDPINTYYSTNLNTSIESCEFCGVKKGKFQNSEWLLWQREELHWGGMCVSNLTPPPRTTIWSCSPEVLAPEKTWHSTVEGKLDLIIRNKPFGKWYCYLTS